MAGLQAHGGEDEDLQVGVAEHRRDGQGFAEVQAGVGLVVGVEVQPATVFGDLARQEMELTADRLGERPGVDDAADAAQMPDGQGSDVAAPVRVVELEEAAQAVAEFEEVGGADGAGRSGWAQRPYVDWQSHACCDADGVC
ncbi:hypothetical protein ABT083_29920 [Streptomyces goshikiensis]|uniref:hypothetical protein n=1 Tax=Streptomyces goshikiensis TaxID=1942 RepID=UPI00332240AA